MSGKTRRRIVAPIIEETFSSGGSFLVNNFRKGKVIPYRASTHFQAAAGKSGLFSYMPVIIAWGHAIFSIMCENPAAKAKERGYRLQ